jgi:hypothetical protein
VFAVVEKPKSHRKSDGVEKVGSDCDHDINRPRLDELTTEFPFRMTRVARRISHDEAGSTALSERGGEELNP